MHRIGISLRTWCIIIIAIGTSNLLGAPIERFGYRFKSVDAESAGFTPSAHVAVFLSADGDEGSVRAGLSELEVGEADVELSILAGALLVSTAHLGDAAAAQRVFETLLENESVEYIAPVYLAPNGTMLAVAPRLTVTATDSAEQPDTDRQTLQTTPAIMQLDVRNGLEVLELQEAIAARADVARAEPSWLQLTAPQARFVVPGDVVKATRHVDGRAAQLATETVWRQMCGDTNVVMPVEQLRHTAEAHAALMKQLPPQAPLGAIAAVPGLDLRFNILSALPAGAADAIAAIEDLLESVFDDPIVVTINLRFASMGAGVLGATGSNYVSDSYADVRTALISGMDFDDSIQDYLPLGGAIPVRYNGNSETVTNETRVYVTRANFNAAIGNIVGTAASMTFNTDFAWDYTPPSISGGQYGFQSVLVHEVGHALGFTSGADFRYNDLEVLDLYRFQRSDGSGTDHNPDTFAEFQTEPRMVDQNAPGTFDDVISDLVTVEYRMSDGQPRQASHFHDQSPPIGLMDPTLGAGQTFYPDFLLQSDGDMFDAIGWDYPTTNTCRVDAPSTEPASSSKNRFIGFAPPSAGSPIALRVRLVSLLSPTGGAPDGSPDFSAFVDQQRWVSATGEFLDSASQGTTFVAAGLACDPECGDFDGIDAIQVFGGDILPDSVYEIQAIRCSCDLADETNFSDALTVVTAHWGDVTLPFFSEVTPLQPDFSDIAAVVAKFTDAPASQTKARTQLQPNLVDPAELVNFTDIATGVAAFVDGIYPFAGPCVCPSTIVCGAAACTSDTVCGDGYCIDGFCTDACGRCTP